MMAKISFLWCLATVLFSLVSTTVGVVISDIFTVQPGTNHGGCDGRIGELNQWLQESIKSVQVAHDAIDDWQNDIRVRRSLSVFFKIPATKNNANALNAAQDIQQELRYLLSFLTNERNDNGVPFYDKSLTWLFCNSDFLTEQQRSSIAKDKDGNEILDPNDNSKKLRIEQIPEYVALLDAGLTETPPVVNKPWWAGDNTGLKGYYFDDQGGRYCDADNLGGTAPIHLLDLGNTVPGETETNSVMICPAAFTGSRPASYQDANNLLTGPGRNLADVLPKSATLVHESFHVIRGGDFLSKDEKYDIAACQNLATSNPDSARANPESYCFFIAHMHHLFGKADGGISKNWDFKFAGSGQNRIFGSIVPGGKDK